MHVCMGEKGGMNGSFGGVCYVTPIHPTASLLIGSKRSSRLIRACLSETVTLGMQQLPMGLGIGQLCGM